MSSERLCPASRRRVQNFRVMTRPQDEQPCGHPHFDFFREERIFSLYISERACIVGRAGWHV